MSDAQTAMEQLRTALDEAGVVTNPKSMTDADIDHITDLAYRANKALEAARIPH